MTRLPAKELIDAIDDFPRRLLREGRGRRQEGQAEAGGPSPPSSAARLSDHGTPFRSASFGMAELQDTMLKNVSGSR